MKKYIGGRASGKTYEIMKIAESQNIPMIVPTLMEEVMQASADYNGFDIKVYGLKRFLTEVETKEKVETFFTILSSLDEKDRKNYYNKRPKVVIDELDEVMKETLGYLSIEAATISANGNKYMTFIKGGRK